MRTLLIAAIALAASGGVQAQSAYPNRAVTMIVGFAPGGGTDAVARILAKSLSDSLGQQVLVENKAGAGGNIATEAVARAAPDGYTILLGSVGSLAVAPHVIANLGYAPLRDFAPITMAVVFANVLVVQASLPIQSLADFVKLAKDKPGTVTFGSSGILGAGHLAGELLKIRANIDIVHVPYKGGGPAMQGMLGGQVASIFATPVSSGGQVKAGKIRAIATTGPKRAALLPDVPTVAESGYPGFEAMNWYAYLAPAKTPKDIVERLNRELVKALNDPAVTELLHKQGLEPSPSTSSELAQYMEREYEVWGKVVKQAGIKAQ
ncbi:MAG: tripartite tricarboxylate transporter substrate binding protein [Betaproteobacteria bacterium]|nr:MAG: tripartite tricarboxylate transporter substrate binding protein [Betaproteobacteria bacterium]